MSILITILIILSSLVALLFIIAMVTKRDFSVERQVTINRSKSDVFDYVRILKNQENYNVWMMRDPNVQITYTGNDGMEGATSAWNSDNKHVGAGEQEIKKINEGESIDMEMRFKKPFVDTNYTSMNVKDAGNNQTTISSRFYGRNEFPRNLMNLMMDKMLGKDMLKNLENMKNVLEK